MNSPRRISLEEFAKKGMAAQQAVDDLIYESYRRSRIRGTSAETMAPHFADAEKLERRFQAEQEAETRRLNESHEVELERESGCYDPEPKDEQ